MNLVLIGSMLRFELYTKVFAQSSTPVLPAYASLYELTPGSFLPKGWIRLYLKKQTLGLGGHLPEVSESFNKAYWNGEESVAKRLTDDQIWFPWEQKAYWIDGLIRCGLALQDRIMVEQAAIPVKYTFNHVALDGYLGPLRLRDAGKDDNGGHTPYFSGQCRHMPTAQIIGSMHMLCSNSIYPIPQPLVVSNSVMS